MLHAVAALATTDLLCFVVYIMMFGKCIGTFDGLDDLKTYFRSSLLIQEPTGHRCLLQV